MSRAFGDEQLERDLRAVLDERAEEMASHARTAAQMTAEIAPRLRSAGAFTWRQEAVLRLVVIALVLLALLAAVVGFGTGPSRPPAHLQLALELPLEGEPGAPPIVDAVRLALGNAALRAGVTIDLPDDAVFDDAVDGNTDAERGTENMQRIAADPRFVAVVGPYHSFVAEAVLPIANAAGIVQCSASNTAPGLTLGDEAASLRSRPDRPSYVRVVSTDDAAARAAARLIFGILGKRSVFVVTTVEAWAGGRSETFIAEFEGLGGTLVSRAAIGDGGDEPDMVARQIEASGAEAVFYDGPSALGGSVLAALASVAGDLPFVGLDIILDGPRSATGSFLEAAGPNVRNAYAVFNGGRDPELGPRVEAAFQAAYGRPGGGYVLTAHACATVLLNAIDRLDPSRLAGPAEWREAIRAEVTSQGPHYATAVGTIGFDANGDATPQRVSIYRADATAGEWTFSEMLELPTGG